MTSDVGQEKSGKIIAIVTNYRAAHSSRKKQNQDQGDLQLAGRERIALADVAGLVAFAEPADALLGRAVGERFRYDVPLGAALKIIVADDAGGAQRFFDVAGFHDMLGPVGVMGPEAGEEIGLELEANRELVVFRFT